MRRYMRERLERAAMELAVCSTLHHPNIVQVYSSHTRVRLRSKAGDMRHAPFVLTPASCTDGAPGSYTQVCLALVRSRQCMHA